MADVEVERRLKVRCLALLCDFIYSSLISPLVRLLFSDHIFFLLCVILYIMLQSVSTIVSAISNSIVTCDNLNIQEAESSSIAPPSIAKLDPRVASALHYAAASSSFAVPPPSTHGPAMSFPSQQLPQGAALLKPSFVQLGQLETTLRSSPAREEGEVPESELDPDTRRRLLILQHGQDMRQNHPSESKFPAHPPMQVSVPRAQPHGWFPVEEDMSPRQVNRVAPPKDFPLNVESLPIDKNRGHHSPFLPKVEPSFPPGRVLPESQRLPMEVN